MREIVHNVILLNMIVTHSLAVPLQKYKISPNGVLEIYGDLHASTFQLLAMNDRVSRIVITKKAFQAYSSTIKVICADREELKLIVDSDWFHCEDLLKHQTSFSQKLKFDHRYNCTTKRMEVDPLSPAAAIVINSESTNKTPEIQHNVTNENVLYLNVFLMAFCGVLVTAISISVTFLIYIKVKSVQYTLIGDSTIRSSTT